ncbi:hypothetical protein EJ02DRAFT_450354 [Clathrospora elynae]|uniref:Cell wall protein PhiA n=1 Tax=Clathrospora elynae TaxID=706981 RepID=A0A6A5T422_9PLEO|nr:hypothetical protein EJ02DRAFT_450354 [Clathrospora elynae]
MAAAAATIATAAPACAAPAAPVTSTISDGDVFRVQTLRSGSDLQFASLQAIKGGLRVNAPEQGSTCGSEVNYASFKLSNGSLFLNTAHPSQQIYVNRSGMGQGIIQYVTGAQQPTKGAEATTFAINDSGYLVFRDQTGEDIGFQACPNALGGGSSIWLEGVTNPGGNSGCIPFTARAQKEDTPEQCSYSQ